MEKNARTAKAGHGDGIYIWISAAALLLAAVLIAMTFFNAGKARRGGDVPSVPTAAPEETDAAGESGAPSAPSVVRLRAEEVSAILAASLPEDFPFEVISIAFSGRQATVNGKAGRDGLIRYLEEGGAQLTSLMRAALGVLPEKTDVVLVMELPESESGAVRLVPVTVSVGGIGLDADLIPASLTDALDKAIDGALDRYGSAVRRVYIDGGELVVEFKA